MTQDNQQYSQYPQYPQQASVNPGRSLGIAGFVLSIIVPVSLIGLILSIIALVQSKRAGMKNGFALAGIIIGAVVVIGAILLLTLGFSTLFQTCQELGNGVHEVNGVTYTCNF